MYLWDTCIRSGKKRTCWLLGHLRERMSPQIFERLTHNCPIVATKPRTTQIVKANATTGFCHLSADSGKMRRAAWLIFLFCFCLGKLSVVRLDYWNKRPKEAILLISVIFSFKTEELHNFLGRNGINLGFGLHSSQIATKLRQMCFLSAKRLSVQQGEGRQARTPDATVARECPTVARQCPTVALPDSPDSCPTVARQLPDNCPTVARQLPDSCPTISPQFRKSGSKTGFRLNFLKRPQIFRNAADFQKKNCFCVDQTPPRPIFDKISEICPNIRMHVFWGICTGKITVRPIFYRIFWCASKLSRLRLFSFAQNSPKYSRHLQSTPRASTFPPCSKPHSSKSFDHSLFEVMNWQLNCINIES